LQKDDLKGSRLIKPEEVLSQKKNREAFTLHGFYD
jgi:hypothetical protein